MTDTITLPRSELQAALDALTNSSPNGHSVQETRDKAIQALRARLAQQEEKPVEDWEAVAIDKAIKNLRHPLSSPRQEEKPEPVAVFDEKLGRPIMLSHAPMLEDGQPLYTAPVAASDTFMRYVAGNEKLRHEEKQEPVAWFVDDEKGFELSGVEIPGWKPLYAAPPKREWQGLTDEEICDVAQSLGVHVAGPASDAINALAAAIEAKLKEKNNG